MPTHVDHRSYTNRVRFEESYEMGRDVVFDEMMIASVARISFRVFMQNKPIRYGFKCWGLADAVTYVAPFTMPFAQSRIT